jgi:hypothetical protein
MLEPRDDHGWSWGRNLTLASTIEEVAEIATAIHDGIVQGNPGTGSAGAFGTD